MRTTQQMSIMLSDEMAAQVKARVASGEYTSESDVIQESIRVLMGRDCAMEQWLRGQVVLAWKAQQHKETISSNDMLIRLKTEHMKG